MNLLKLIFFAVFMFLMALFVVGCGEDYALVSTKAIDQELGESCSCGAGTIQYDEAGAYTCLDDQGVEVFPEDVLVPCGPCGRAQKICGQACPQIELNPEEFACVPADTPDGDLVFSQEITRGQVTTILGEDHIGSDRRGLFPSWQSSGMLSIHHAMLIANWYSESYGLTACYQFDGLQTRIQETKDQEFPEFSVVECPAATCEVQIVEACNGFRVPSAAEWRSALEFSEGTLMPHQGVEAEYDRWGVGSFPDAQPPCSYKANSHGLCDLLGNQEEWVLDEAGVPSAIGCSRGDHWGKDPESCMKPEQKLDESYYLRGVRLIVSARSLRSSE
jgi:hypothetical protein